MASNLLLEHDILLNDYLTRQYKISELQKSDDIEKKKEAHELQLYNDGINRAFSQIFGYSLYNEIQGYITSKYKEKLKIWEEILNETNS